MDFIREINAFELWLQASYLPPTAQLLWYKVFMLFNRAGWPEWLVKKNLDLMVLVGITNEKTFIRYRDILIESGLLEYQKGKKGCPNKYRIVSFSNRNAVKNTVYPTVYPTVQTTVQTTVHSTDVSKHKRKPKQKQGQEICGALPTHTQRFVPPTLEDVTAYCRERGNAVDPERFVNFYESKGWMVGKNKMKSWQACVRTWEKDAQGAKPETAMSRLMRDDI